MTTYTRPQDSYFRAADREPVSDNSRGLGDLFSDLTQNASLLARQEVLLAKVEMQRKVRDAGGDIATIAVGGVLANAALLALVAAAIVGLSNYVDLWLSALIVGVVIGLIAALLIFRGVEALKEMTPVPEQTMASLEENKEWLSRQLN